MTCQEYIQAEQAKGRRQSDIIADPAYRQVYESQKREESAQGFALLAEKGLKVGDRVEWMAPSYGMSIPIRGTVYKSKEGPRVRLDPGCYAPNRKTTYFHKGWNLAA